MYSRAIKRMLARYGRQCFILPYGGGKKIAVKAFLNPLLSQNKTYIGGEYLPDGYFDGGHYLYVGDGSVRIDNLPLGSVILCDGQKYVIKRAEQYIVGADVVYSWAVLQLAGRSVDDGCGN